MLYLSTAIILLSLLLGCDRNESYDEYNIDSVRAAWLKKTNRQLDDPVAGWLNVGYRNSPSDASRLDSFVRFRNGEYSVVGVASELDDYTLEIVRAYCSEFAEASTNVELHVLLRERRSLVHPLDCPVPISYFLWNALDQPFHW